MRSGLNYYIIGTGVGHRKQPGFSGVGLRKNGTWILHEQVVTQNLTESSELMTAKIGKYRVKH